MSLSNRIFSLLMTSSAQENVSTKLKETVECDVKLKLKEDFQNDFVHVFLSARFLNLETVSMSHQLSAQRWIYHLRFWHARIQRGGGGQGVRTAWKITKI